MVYSILLYLHEKRKIFEVNFWPEPAGFWHDLEAWFWKILDGALWRHIGASDCIPTHTLMVSNDLEPRTMISKWFFDGLCDRFFSLSCARNQILSVFSKRLKTELTREAFEREHSGQRTWNRLSFGPDHDQSRNLSIRVRARSSSGFLWRADQNIMLFSSESTQNKSLMGGCAWDIVFKLPESLPESAKTRLQRRLNNVM